MSASRRDSGAPLPFGVLLATDESAPPLPQRRLSYAGGRDEPRDVTVVGSPRPHRRDARGPGRAEPRESAPAPGHPLPRRRDLRPGGHGPTGHPRQEAAGDLFTPRSPVAPRRRFAPDSPPAGTATPGASEASSEWFTPSMGIPVAAPASPPRGIQPEYPRRRDLRRQGITVPVQRSLPAPGSTFVPAGAEPDGCVAPLGTGPFPRRRDLRGAEEHGPGAAEQPERNGSVVVGVARAAVLTMLVGAGYAAVSGQHLNIAGVDASGLLAHNTQAGSGALMALPAAVHTPSGWDVSNDLKAAKSAGEKIEAARAAASKAAAARAAAAKAAAAARAEARARAMRDAQRNPKAVAKLLAADRGWTGSQFTCLDLLWTRESNWNYRATNASSGAYGIPQALPGSKMGTVASDWTTNPVTQIKWGLGYIAGRYGTPCGAWAHSQATGWY